MENLLTFSTFPDYNSTVKNADEDSRVYLKDTANRGRWKPDASKIHLNITSELQLLKNFGRNLVNADGIPPLQERI